jgi:pimeloyl-ACP methyl ester carboxylesterase
MKIKQALHSTGQLSLNVAEVGSEGPLLVMFHGVTQRWQTFIPLISTLGLRHRLWLVDGRGHGESDRGVGYRVVDYIEDACDLIRQLNVPVSVYGHSLGSMVAAGVAAELGSTITAVVMEDPPLHAMGERIGETHLLNFFKAMSKFAGTNQDAGEVAGKLGDVTFHDPVSGSDIRLADVRDPIQRRFSAACLTKLDPAVYEPIVAGRWLDGYHVERVFRSIVCPSLLLQADVAAGGMLTEADAEYVESLNKSLVRIPFSGIGHTIHTGATQALLNTVVAFLESIAG